MTVGVIPCPTCGGNAPSCLTCWGSGKVECCGNCGATKEAWEQRSHSTAYVDYDWYCTNCDTYIRPSAS